MLLLWKEWTQESTTDLSNIFKQKQMVMMMEVLHHIQQVEQIEVSKTKVGVVYKSI